jgi:hypothetical protein
MNARYLWVALLVGCEADLCPDDDDKIEGGACGCGVPDDDLDGTGVPDCLDAGVDLCPEDDTKTVPGTCGCGASDDDVDGTGVPDCLDAGVDLCPDDDGKSVPGTCGCGVSDDDLDGTGVPDCLDSDVDLCPDDPEKVQGGPCGCGVPDVDTNDDGVPDCFQDAFSVVIIDRLELWPNIVGISGLAVVVNHALEPIELSAATAENVRLNGAPLPESGFQIVPSVFAGGEPIPPGQRTNDASNAVLPILLATGWANESVAASSHLSIAINIQQATTGDHVVEFDLVIDERRAPVRMEVDISEEGGTSFARVGRFFGRR